MDANQIKMTKAILWEEAKGKLRALVEAEGHRRLVGAAKTMDELTADEHRSGEVRERVEDFIAQFEADGLEE